MTAAEKREKISELKNKIEKTKEEYDRAKAMNLALKLTLNGTYGAFAHPKFVLSNSHIANAITAMGRDVIQYMLKKIEKYFYKEWNLDTISHEKLGIEYIAEKNGKFYLLDRTGENIHYPHNSLDELITKLNITRSDLKEDKKELNEYNILYLRNIHDFSNIQPIDKDMPIIIYGDTDSLYISFAPMMKSCDYKGDELDFILHLDRVVIKKKFNQYLDEYAAKFGVKNIHDFELETINRSALHIQKKHYINNVAWEDGIFYENLSYFYPKGVEIVKSSTPLFVRENIYEFLRYMFSNPNNLNIRKILLLVKDLKKQFMMADIEDISMTTSCSNYQSKVIDDVTDVVTVKGAHFGVKAAALHNYLLNKNSEYKIKYDNIRGGRIKYYYCNHPKNNVFAYMRSMHPYEIVEKEGVKIDYDEQFEVTFLSIINRFLEPIGLPTINKRLSVLNSIFSI
jgi:DNA polymerase elongation subunit (family B)